ncbi:MAG TPA: stage 0 sporulation family protein, partial [Roseiflexaceae bacterium]|nr:stage 0 sporulation family protein [Roseiflexaceae bacterium]
MPVVVGIRFKDSGKTYFFDPNGFNTLMQGDSVIVETVRGLELAKVAYAPHDVNQSEIVGDLRPVIRRAEQSDFDRMRLLAERHDEVMARCAEKIGEHSLGMRLVKAEYSFDGSRLTFYFTADKRIDFRALVRDLARTFRTRIELRQIGPRDEAKLLGGIGPCGRLLCCATFLPDYARVSIKMAKDQDLPLNPSKISGVCGRLLCCLSYEHEQYLEIKAELPRRGAWVQTPDGPGEVVAVNVVRETVTVELGGSGVHEEFSPTQISVAAQRVGDLARSRAAEGIAPFADVAS